MCDLFISNKNLVYSDCSENISILRKMNSGLILINLEAVNN